LLVGRVGLSFHELVDLLLADAALFGQVSGDLGLGHGLGHINDLLSRACPARHRNQWSQRGQRRRSHPPTHARVSPGDSISKAFAGCGDKTSEKTERFNGLRAEFPRFSGGFLVPRRPASTRARATTVTDVSSLTTG